MIKGGESMELQTNSVQKTTKLKVSTIFIGLGILIIPIGIGVLINMPEVMEWVKLYWKEISKGIMIGVSILPVMLFVTIKGGGCWYKRWWTWGLLVIVIAMVIGISFLGSAGTETEVMKEMGISGVAPFY